MTRPLLLLALLTAPALAQQAPAPSLQNLLSNPPFGVATAGPGAPAAATPLEFRGTFVDRGERFFSLADPSTKKAAWVTLNESGHPFLVKGYDAESETVTVDFQGRSLSLKLRAAKIAAMALPPPQQAQPAMPGPGQPGVPAVPSASPTNTSEAQRLAQVAEEIRRRRALRQQAAQPGTPPPNPPQPR